MRRALVNMKGDVCSLTYFAYAQGHAYNTFPKMGDTWIPEGIFEMSPFIRNFFENTATVQVINLLSALFVHSIFLTYGDRPFVPNRQEFFLVVMHFVV